MGLPMLTKDGCLFLWLVHEQRVLICAHQPISSFRRHAVANSCTLWISVSAPNDLSPYFTVVIIGWPLLHSEYTHRGTEHLGQTHNLCILLLMCDIVRRISLTLTHPALRLGHQDPIR
jgi:hypothetical protein